MYSGLGLQHTIGGQERGRYNTWRIIDEALTIIKALSVLDWVYNIDEDDLLHNFKNDPKIGEGRDSNCFTPWRQATKLRSLLDSWK